MLVSFETIKPSVPSYHEISFLLSNLNKRIIYTKYIAYFVITRVFNDITSQSINYLLQNALLQTKLDSLHNNAFVR